MQSKEKVVEGPGTEEIIFQSAMRIFIKNGYKGTRMQDIADEANLNKALLHYYFRSKEELFKKVLRQLMSQLVELISNTLFSDQDTQTVLSGISEHHLRFYQDKKGFPLFLMNTMHSHPELVVEVMDKTSIRHLTYALMAQKISETSMSEQEVILWFMSFLSLKMMPLVGQDLFKYLLQTDDEKYQSLLHAHAGYTVQLMRN